jgi:hypothetical protein
MPKLEKYRAVALGEFGGLGYPVKGHTWKEEDNWGYVNFKNTSELKNAYSKLIYKLMLLKKEGLSAAVYTQLTDVEGEVNGNSSIITLQYVYALQMAADMFKAFGYRHQAREYRQLSQSLIKKTYKLCWSDNRGLIADTPEKTSFSQHTNIMAILVGMFDKDTADSVMQRVLSQKDLTQLYLLLPVLLKQSA